jgi:glycolate oxidase iron-sulfur subunit
MTYTPLLQKSIRFLQKSGYGVYVPEAQGCCGALFAHSGHVKEASLCQKSLQTTLAPFAHLPLLTLATGCERDLHTIFPKTQSLTDFLLTHCPLSTPHSPLPRFAWHIPCTQKKPGIFETFLEKHAIQYYPLPQTCCGAAGVQMLTQPAQADALGNVLLEAIPTTISYILSSNLGCQTHLQALFRARHPKNQVLHPLELLFKTGFFE